jgi:hypothetical protein
MATTTVPSCLIPSVPAANITGSLPVAQVSGVVPVAQIPDIDTQKLTTERVRASMNTGPAMATDAWTSVVYNLEEGDTETCYDQGSGVFTAVKSGIYIVHAAVEALNFPTVGKTAMLAVYKNSTQMAIGKMSGAANPCSVSATTILWLDAGNTVSVKVWHNEGSTKYLSSASETNFLCIARIGGG